MSVIHRTGTAADDDDDDEVRLFVPSGCDVS